MRRRMGGWGGVRQMLRNDGTNKVYAAYKEDDQLLQPL